MPSFSMVPFGEARLVPLWGNRDTYCQVAARSCRLALFAGSIYWLSNDVGQTKLAGTGAIPPISPYAPSNNPLLSLLFLTSSARPYNPPHFRAIYLHLKDSPHPSTVVLRSVILLLQIPHSKHDGSRFNRELRHARAPGMSSSTPPFHLPLTLPQFFWTLLIMCLIGNMIAERVGGSPSVVNYAMFCAVIGFLSLFYLIPATFVESLRFHPFLMTGVDVLNTFFYFTCAVALSAELTTHSCGNTVCFHVTIARVDAMLIAYIRTTFAQTRSQTVPA